jgi:hypothetical protein
VGVSDKMDGIDLAENFAIFFKLTGRLSFAEIG